MTDAPRVVAYSSKLRGSEGPQGPEGVVGPQGPVGPVGPEGEKGLKITFKGVFDTKGELPYDAALGDAYVTDSDNHLYVWDGFEWIDTGSFRGPKGPKGDPGKPGIPGPKGVKGPQGLRGRTGPIGNPGPRGNAGPTGKEGDQGPEGDPGEKGLHLTVLSEFGLVATIASLPPNGLIPRDWDGPNRPSYQFQMERYQAFVYNPADIHDPNYGNVFYFTDPGWVDADGQIIGPQGPDGPKGKLGPQGKQGPQGIVGEVGDEGPHGDVGPQGPQGIPGVQGIEGIRGIKGLEGDRGPKGLTGPKGPLGDQGVQGDIGDRGIPGVSGHSFDLGTAMLFYQSAAPTGWYQVNEDYANNRGIRIVMGGGGGVGGDADPCYMNQVIYHAHTFGTSSVDLNHTHQFGADTGGETGHTHGFDGGNTGAASADHTQKYKQALAYANGLGGGGTAGNVQNQGGPKVTNGISVGHVHALSGTVGGSTGHIHNVAGGVGYMDYNNIHNHTGQTEANGGSSWNARYFNAIVCKYQGV